MKSTSAYWLGVVIGATIGAAFAFLYFGDG